MTVRPDLTVAAVVERDGHFLLVEERVGNRMVFNQPAGHVERGELFLDAVVAGPRSDPRPLCQAAQPPGAPLHR